RSSRRRSAWPTEPSSQRRRSSRLDTTSSVYPFALCRHFARSRLKGVPSDPVTITRRHLTCSVYLPESWTIFASQISDRGKNETSSADRLAGCKNFVLDCASHGEQK